MLLRFDKVTPNPLPPIPHKWSKRFFFCSLFLTKRKVNRKDSPKGDSDFPLWKPLKTVKVNAPDKRH